MNNNIKRYQRNMPMLPNPDEGYTNEPGAGYPVPPIAGGGQPAYPGNDFPVPPIAPPINPPAFPGPDYPVPPIAPPVNPPAFPGPDYPVPPIAPPGTPPAYPGPTYPVIPLPPCLGCIITPNKRYCKARFLNAAAGYSPLRVNVETLVAAERLPYSDISDYVGVMDGFRVVTIVSARSPRTILLRKTMPFRAGEVVTMAIINTKNGIDLISISDMGCESSSRRRSCFRVSNLSYDNMAVDILLRDGRMVFSDVRFKETTSFKRIATGNYYFYISETQNYPMPIDAGIEVIERMPVAMDERFMIGNGEVETILSFIVNVREGHSYTAYIIGGYNINAPLQVLVTED